MAQNFKVINGQIIRSPKRGAVNYTPISNKVLQNTELSFGARGLLIYILSLPIDWVPVKSQIRIKNNYKPDRFDTMWKELVKKGYIHSERVKDDKSGKFLGWSHQVYEEPIVGKTESRKTRDSENHTITKDTTYKKHNIEKKDITKEGDKLNSFNTKESTPSFSELFYKGGDSETARDFINNKL